MKKSYLVRTIILAGSLLLQLSTLCFQSHGAAGDVDLSFDPGSGVNGHVFTLALQPDGKVIIGGSFTTVKGLARINLARLNADGSGDSSFTAGAYGAPYGVPNAIALQPDGKVLVGHDYGLNRLNSDGSLDTNFVAGIHRDYSGVSSIAVQLDGKVLIGGFFYSADGTTSLPEIVRLNSNGSLDTNFNAGAGWTGVLGTAIYSIALQSDGKVLVGGQWTTTGGTNNGIVRLNANGSLDNSFNPGTGVNGQYVYSVAVQSDGKVLIGGEFTTVNGTNRNRIARLNANGSLDSSFNPGTGVGGVAGHFTGVRSVVVQSDGKVLFGGGFNTVNGTNVGFGIARLNADGSLDSSFHPGTGANGSVASVALQSGGRILIGGDFTTVNGTNRNRMARLNADGSLDDSFHPGRGVVYWSGSLAVQADGKVIVGGVRLNADGSLDSTYIQPTNNPGDPFPADISFPGSDYVFVTCGAVQSDGKRLFGGYFATTYVDDEGSITRWTQHFLMRFNADATRDTNFVQVIGGPDYGQSDYFLPMTLVVQPDGKLLFTPRHDFKRLNANGTPDTNFVAVANPVSSIRLQPDGRIFIAGGFAFVNGTQRGGIARLNPDGSLDNSFNPGTGANGDVSSFVFQPDGKMLIGGSFTAVNGTNRNRIARLHANGSLDTSFNPGTGADGSVRAIALQSDGHVLIGGGFLTVDGVLRPYVARLYGDSPAPSLSIARSNAFMIVSWPVMGLNFQLQENMDLSLPDSWTPAVQTAVTNAGHISVTVPTTVGRKFFQLQSQ